jgi:hypothetical protein
MESQWLVCESMLAIGSQWLLLNSMVAIESHLIVGMKVTGCYGKSMIAMESHLLL